MEKSGFGWFTTASSLDEENIYTGNWDGNIYAFRQADGVLIWKEKYGMAWPVVAEDILIIPNHPPQDALKGEMIVAISEKPPATISNLFPPQTRLNFGNKLMWKAAGIFLLIAGIGGMIIFWGRRILTRNFKKT